MSTPVKIISWLCRIIVAVIFLQTLFFKFTGAPESKYIFTQLMGAEYEAVGRIGSGIFELLTAVLILIPRTAAVGAVFALGTISGAILSHLTTLGIVVQDDGGTLFILALTIFALSAVVLIIHFRELPLIGYKG